MAEENQQEEPKVTPQGQSLAIPRGSRLIKVGQIYRIVWDLGGGMGWAWYDVSRSQLKNLYGENFDSYVADRVGNVGVFKAKYGDYHWGNVAEISETADTPWKDMMDRIYDTFGHIAGLETDEIKRLILQGWFEGWTPNEFVAQYQGSDYFNTLNDAQRKWAVSSDAEKQSLIGTTGDSLYNTYRATWGEEPPGGRNGSFIQNSALRVASGEVPYSTWSYRQTKQAEKTLDTPAHRKLIEEQQAQGEREVTIEQNMGLIEDLWRQWVGPTDIYDSNFVKRWATNIYLNNNSWEDLENKVKTVAQNRWEFKDPELTWEEWAGPYREKIQNMLETSTVGDSDPLLNQILDNGLTGVEATQAIRQDERFKSTNLFYGELANRVAQVGRDFGFIA